MNAIEQARHEDLFFHAGWLSFSANVRGTASERIEKWKGAKYIVINGRVSGDPSDAYRLHDMSRNDSNRMACYIHDCFGIDILSRVYDAEKDRTLLVLEGDLIKNMDGRLDFFVDESEEVAYLLHGESDRVICKPIERPF